MAFNSFSSNQGTQTALLTDNTGGTGGTLIPVMKLDYSGAGTAGSLFTGTILGVNNIGTLPNIPGGTLNSLGGTVAVNIQQVSGTTPNFAKETGGNLAQIVTETSDIAVNTSDIITTLTNGSMNGFGTYQLNPLVATNTISHAGTSGTIATGTLISAIGAGTGIYPTNYRIVVISGTCEVCLSFGTVTNGAQVVHHGLYPAGGGIANPIPYPHKYGTTNSPLTYQIISGSGTVSWDIDYFTHT